MAIILSIKYGGHDTAASLMINGEIIAACSQERYTRDKHSRKFPIDAINDCLSIGKISMNDVDEIAFVNDYKKYIREIYLKTALDCDQRLDFLINDIDRIKHVYNIEEFIRKQLNYEKKIKFYNHHMCHSASAYFPSGFRKALCMSIDGMGEIETQVFSSVEDGNFKELHNLNIYPNSLGLAYSAITDYLGWKHHCDEGIIMGLAPYGDFNAKVPGQKKTYKEIFEDIIVSEENLKFVINRDYIDYYTKRDQWVTKKFLQIFGAKRDYSEKIDDNHKNIASALQNRLETIVLDQLKKINSNKEYEYLCIAGGVGLNCSLNGKIEKSKIFKEIFIQPASADDGCTIGACYIANSNYPNNEFKAKKRINSYKGSSFNNDQIESIIKGYNLDYSRLDNIEKETAKEILNGKIIAWFQGSAEFGPRALGNRSILCKPFPLEMKDYLNKMVKFREEFRPFAPSVMKEYQDCYFELKQDSYHMLVASKVIEEKKDVIPAVVHVDNTCRVQTVSEESNKKFYKLLNEFNIVSGVPVLLNTSFNVKGQPIVNTPNEAIDTFLNTKIDVLSIGDCIIKKS